MTDAHAVVEAFWAAAEARDWDAFGKLLADDVVYQGPQTRERVRGRAAYLRFNVEGFPGAWHLEVKRIIGEGTQAASWVEFTETEGRQPGLCFFELNESGLIARINDFWPDPYELPASRAHLVERYCARDWLSWPSPRADSTWGPRANRATGGLRAARLRAGSTLWTTSHPAARPV